MRSSLKDVAYNTLKERLVNCIYAPGSMLKESALAEELGISRTPIREAISLLETEGYLVIAPKKGIFVTDITLNDIVQVFQVRMEIEPIALKMAIPNLSLDSLMELRQTFSNKMPDVRECLRQDSEMHLFLIDHCRNKYIIDMMHNAFEQNTRIVVSSTQNIDHVKESRSEHVEILDTLIQQDYELACKQMHEHIKHCRRSAIDYFYSS